MSPCKRQRTVSISCRFAVQGQVPIKDLSNLAKPCKTHCVQFCQFDIQFVVRKYYLVGWYHAKLLVVHCHISVGRNQSLEQFHLISPIPIPFANFGIKLVLQLQLQLKGMGEFHGIPMFVLEISWKSYWKMWSRRHYRFMFIHLAFATMALFSETR